MASSPLAVLFILSSRLLPCLKLKLLGYTFQKLSKDDIPCGTIAIVGRPNVGKSNLLNALIQQKISITSRKAQTTRYRIQGIYTCAEAQYIFVDTPGFQTRYGGPLNQSLN